MIDAVEAILKQDLPPDAKFSRRQALGCKFIVVSIWPRRYITRKEDAHPLSFEVRIVGKNALIYRVRHPDTVGSGPPFAFELANPECFKQMYDFFAKECVL